jgi:hypothetical protein
MSEIRNIDRSAVTNILLLPATPRDYRTEHNPAKKLKERKHTGGDCIRHINIIIIFYFIFINFANFYVMYYYSCNIDK